MGLRNAQSVNIINLSFIICVTVPIPIKEDALVSWHINTWRSYYNNYKRDNPGIVEQKAQI